jgi:hypothetical protein
MHAVFPAQKGGHDQLSTVPKAAAIGCAEFSWCPTGASLSDSCDTRFAELSWQLNLRYGLYRCDRKLSGKHFKTYSKEA